jgi:hypothetical protein
MKQMTLRRLGTWLRLLLLNLAFTLLLGEGLLRLFGWGPVPSYRVVSHPQQHLAIHPEWGFQLREGAFSVTINDSLTYQSTQRPTDWGVCRVSSPAPSQDDRPVLVLSGCSFPYGMGVEDSESYPFLVQQQWPQLRVINAGIPAHGTLQSLLRLRAALAEGHQPHAFVYHYLDSHQHRNLLSRSFAQLLRVETRLRDAQDTLRAVRFPRGRMVGEKQLDIQAVEVTFHPLFGKAREWSALANQLEELYSRLLHSRTQAEAVTRACIREMQRLCEAEGIFFAVAILSEDPKRPFMQQLCQEEGLLHLDLTVDYTDPSYFNWPYDGHPNAGTHRLYAQRLTSFLQQQAWVAPLPAKPAAP